MPDYEAMFKLLWAERNVLLQMVGQVPFAAPPTEEALRNTMRRASPMGLSSRSNHADHHV